MVNIYIADNNIEDITKYSELIYDMRFDINVKIFTCDPNENVENHLKDLIEKVDVIITNTKHGRTNCINMMKKVRKNNFKGEIIFMTEDKDSVFDTFEVEPLDYILKDNIERLEKSVKNAVTKLADEHLDYIILGNSNRRNKIFKKNISYVESIGRKMIVHEVDGNSSECYMNVSEMLDILDDEAYARVHKSYIVNYDNIKKVDSHTIFVDNNIQIPIGKAYVEEIKKVMSYAIESKIYIS